MARNYFGVGGGQHLRPEVGARAVVERHRCAQRRELLRPHAQQGAERAGVAAEAHVVLLVDDAREVGDEHVPAPRRKIADRRHDRRAGGHGAAAEVVAVAEPAGQDDEVEIVERGVAVPHHAGPLPGGGFQVHARLPVRSETP